MDLVWTLVTGVAAGWLAGQIMKRPGSGWLGNLIVGVIGSLLGSYLFGLIGPAAYGLLGRLVMAAFGAVILITLLSFFRGK